MNSLTVGFLLATPSALFILVRIGMRWRSLDGKARRAAAARTALFIVGSIAGCAILAALSAAGSPGPWPHEAASLVGLAAALALAASARPSSR